MIVHCLKKNVLSRIYPKSRLREGRIECPGSSSITCELCNCWDSLFCDADSAYLCQACYASVHSSNFLFATHVRCILCRTCQGITSRCIIGSSQFNGERHINFAILTRT
ncbi:hypothetical protein AMTRI_Chr02g258910 [Amborella trichopoda]